MPRVTTVPFAVGATLAAAAAWEHRSRKHAERLAAALLETLLNAIDATDPQTGAHVRRVARFALVLAEAAGVDHREWHSIERVALFHDIGKIHEALFDLIHDERELTPEDRKAIATHPRRGAEVLSPLDSFYPDLGEGVLSHHERWDGKGYPRKLARERIPLAARIVAIADTFDAVLHSRRYRAGRGRTEAKRVIGEGRGTQFDPLLVDLFLSPPVFAEIEREMKEASQPPPKNGRGRRKSREATAPDITFRWRSEDPAPRARDPGHRTARE
jgi:HD-GYP domain-containing protein (c-di-GMP phosphodiesterase class II)